MTMNKTSTTPAKRFYTKKIDLFRLIEKIKLWPSRQGLLHGIRTIEAFGSQARVTTHCQKSFVIYNSRNSRAARWLRGKMASGVCDECRVPDWKLEKYASTRFNRHFGSQLTGETKGK